MNTDLLLQLLLLLLIFIVAFLYASVGHGGASGYIAVLALFGTASIQIKTSALILNILVSSIAFFQYYRAGYFRWKLFYPFAITSIPLSYLGAQIVLEDSVYKKILAVCLLFPIARLMWNARLSEQENKAPNIYLSLLIGAAIGLLSGMLGIGGGIILSPILLVLHWANMKETAAVSALFILVNSLAGFASIIQKGIPIESSIFPLILLAVSGGILGAYAGSKKLKLGLLKNILSLVLVIAVFKLFFT